jgi:hypothetical protein
MKNCIKGVFSLGIGCFLMVGAQASAQSVTGSKTSGLVDPHAYAGSTSAGVTVSKPAVSSRVRPFSRVAFGGGISLLGVHLLAATNVNRHLDVRGDGRFFQYNVGNFQADGFNISPRLNLASAGVSLDFYPFPRHGLRLTPGVLFYNHNEASSAVIANSGTITLNGDDYFPSASNPVTGTATLNLHPQTPAFTVTTGWGSFLHADGRHWSFPFEIGVAFIGSPSVDLALTSGQTCDYTGLNCVDVTSNQQLQKDLQAQAAKYKHDMDPLKTFPILGGGVVYSFGIRSR